MKLYDYAKFEKYVQPGINEEDLQFCDEKDQAKYRLAEKFSYAFIVYHTHMRRIKPENAKYSLERLRMLGAIRVQERCSLKKLCKILYISKSTGSLMVDSLVKEGLVKREQDLLDRRKVLLSLTPEGARIADDDMRGEVYAYYTHFKALEEADVKRFGDALETIVEVLEKVELDEENDH